MKILDKKITLLKNKDQGRIVLSKLEVYLKELFLAPEL